MKRLLLFASVVAVSVLLVACGAVMFRDPGLDPADSQPDLRLLGLWHAYEYGCRDEEEGSVRRECREAEIPVAEIAAQRALGNFQCEIYEDRFSASLAYLYIVQTAEGLKGFYTTCGQELGFVESEIDAVASFDTYVIDGEHYAVAAPITINGGRYLHGGKFVMRYEISEEGSLLISIPVEGFPVDGPEDIELYGTEENIADYEWIYWIERPLREVLEIIATVETDESFWCHIATMERPPISGTDARPSPSNSCDD